MTWGVKGAHSVSLNKKLHPQPNKVWACCGLSKSHMYILLKIGTISEFHIESISVFLDNMNHLLLWSNNSHLYEKVVIIWFSSFSFPVFLRDVKWKYRSKMANTMKESSRHFLLMWVNGYIFYLLLHHPYHNHLVIMIIENSIVCVNMLLCLLHADEKIVTLWSRLCSFQAVRGIWWLNHK